jgi:hypothetical protein
MRECFTILGWLKTNTNMFTTHFKFQSSRARLFVIYRKMLFERNKMFPSFTYDALKICFYISQPWDNFGQ